HAIEQSIQKVEGISPREGTFRAIDPRFITISGGGSAVRNAQQSRKAQLNELEQQTIILEDISGKLGFAA
ncbi:MAG: hypothetical protein QGD93_10305, partial [Actinomycetota bacterium]|nr:hypothetical protein [Actinomycetota bacterium]